MSDEHGLAANTNYSLYPEQKAIVNQFAKDTGQNSSAALRFIIMDWVRMKREALGMAAPVTQEQMPA